MTNDEYHALGKGTPDKLILSASQLALFRPGRADPQAFYRRYVLGEETPKSWEMWAGTFLHGMLLEGWVVETIKPLEWTAELGKNKKETTCRLEGARMIEGHYVPPPDLNHASNLGKELWLGVEAQVKALGATLVAPISSAGTPSPALAAKALDEALVTALRLNTPSAMPVAAQHLRYVLMEAEGDVEQVHFATFEVPCPNCDATGVTDSDCESCFGYGYTEVKVRIKPDKVLADDGSIHDLKRTRYAASGRRCAEEWRMQLAFYEAALPCDYCDGRGEIPVPKPSTVPTTAPTPCNRVCPFCSNQRSSVSPAGHGAPRRWFIDAINPAGPTAIGWEIHPDQQALGRLELEAALQLYVKCRATGVWCLDEERIRNPMTPAPKPWEYDSVEESEDEDDA